ncbi:MAG: beta-propeller domain-containing protein [Polyangiaceae bacterium]
MATLGWACGGSDNAPGGGTERVEGQSDFVSAPPSGFVGGSRDSIGGSTGSGGGGGAGGTTTGTPTSPPGGSGTGSTPDRQVEETDLYRVEGDRLYYINGYRGLMVFDVSDISAPKLLGRSPIFGSPVEMVVRNGIAVIVVADWYGRMDDGSPFHGSVVRGLDATDPTNIRLVGEAKLGGWVSDTRVVGDVIYAVSEEYGWNYGWATDGDTTDSTGGAGGGVGTSGPGVSTSKAVVSSVSFAGGEIRSVGRYDVPGYGGIFNVTANSILFAHDVAPPNADPNRYTPSTDMALDYVDISDPGGSIVARGHAQFAGHVPSWGTDNGRWNLDFADGKVAHIAACGGQYCGDGLYQLATVDFTNPDAPSVRSKIALPTTGYSPAVRFDRGRMYLAPGGGYSGSVSPIQVFDLADPAAPKLAGQTQIAGTVWNFTPAGDRLFTLGNERDPFTGYYGSKISVSYLDVSDPARPVAMGSPATFGEGWAWTPAAGTFKAFTKNETEGLVVLPFSGYSYNYRQYNNGLQLIEFTPTSIKTSGAARTKGWVERGVFVKGKLVSLSDTSLAVVDYANHADPKVVAELTLARNVVDAQPHGGNVALLSSDWYSYDHDQSELRILPIDQVDEKVSGAALAEVAIEGVNARVYHNGELSYVVTNVEHEVACGTTGGGDTPGSGGAPGKPGDATTKCYRWREQVQVVDFSSGTAVLRGKIALPDLGYYSYYGMGFGGCYMGDWYYGDSSVQVGGDVLAFRRWAPNYWNGGYVDGHASLYVVDLSNPDAPGIASTVITRDKDGWWGNMRAIGDTLYTSHYEWRERPVYPSTVKGTPGYVRYYLDRIDLSDRTKPRIGSSINVPGMLVGGSETDPSLLYTVDYRWSGERETSEFNVLKLRDGKAYLQSSLPLAGNPGSTFVRGDKAYMSVQQYLDKNYSRSVVKLYQLDLSNPKAIVQRTSEQKKGWGWLLGVEGDRALVTSGWGSNGIDIYKLTADGDPQFDQFVRTLGYSARATSRQGDQIFLASGQWGVQTVDLK